MCLFNNIKIKSWNLSNCKFKEIEYEKEEEDTFGGRWSDHDLERNKEKLPWKEEKEVEKGQKIGWEMR